MRPWSLIDNTDMTVSRKRQSFPNLVFALIAFTGVLIASYPSMSQWITAHQRADKVTGYSESLERAEPEVLEDVIEDALQYNQNMPGVLVSDPYSLNEAQNKASGAWDNYLEALKIPDTDVMATIRIPSIHVNLPVRHGTDDAVLSAGAGHLFGSSLPVGGERTHSVITAHTALSRAYLFDDLDEVQLGDRFHVDVAGETLTYEVEFIDVVLPHEVESLSLESGRDLLTLVTCAPPTVNSHRLLVRGARVVLVDGEELAGQQTNRDSTDAGFPWWTLWVGGSGIALALFALRREKPQGETTSRVPSSGSSSDSQERAPLY